MTSSRMFQPYAILPVLVIATAFVLSFLCVFAGSSPGMMEEYAVFTLNVSRIGQNTIEKIDDKIMGLNISKVLNKRSLPASVAALPTITAAPIVPRQDMDSIFDGIGSDINSLTSKAGGKASSAESAIKSKATAIQSEVASGVKSIESLAASKISSAFTSAQTAVVDAINDTYIDFVEELDLRDFYAIYLRNTCSGEYITPNGTNITIGVSPAPPNGTQKVIDTCDKHSSLNPLILVRVLYYIGIAFTGIALLLGIWAVISYSRKKALANICASVAALCFFALASAISHGVAVAATGLLNFTGSAIGVAAYKGDKLITLTWATTILVVVNVGLWIILFFVGERLPQPKRKVRHSENLPEHEMQIRHLHLTPSQI